MVRNFADSLRQMESNRPLESVARQTFIGIVTVLLYLGPLVFSSLACAQNPVPLINQPLVPETATPGGPGFTLRVNGTGFVPGSVVHWNGAARSTHFVDQGRVTATISATDIAKNGTASITVINPGPGGGSSEVVFFPISAPRAAVPLARTDFSPTGVWNIYVVTGDFNRDGKLDLAVTEFISGQVQILLGNGDGTFQFFQTYPACHAHGLASGDLNGDGIVDLIVGDAGCGQVTVLLGHGDGTFTERGNFSTGGGATFAPYSVAVGDFNSDGKLDLATADEGLNRASVLLGNGDGTFQTHVDYDTGEDSRQIATGDFNSDGRLDLAVSSSQGVSILLGNGDGTFQPQTLYMFETNDNPYLIIADLNGDGKLDLAVANTAGSVSILLGNGDGTFQNSVRYATGGFSATVIAADFNGDGILDLATGNYYDANIAILLGNGDGTFRAHINYPAASGARGLVAADFKRDGRLDLAVANQFVDSISVFLQPTLDTTPPRITVALNPVALWPPKGKLVPVTVSGTITDTGSGVNASTATYAVKDEYGEVQPTGRISLGPTGNYSFKIWLQASRRGSDLDGRRYTIIVRAKDNAGNVRSKTGVVTVPHDQGS
jgi:FG-GAP-like repeat/FG-GAP repeat